MSGKEGKDSKQSNSAGKKSVVQTKSQTPSSNQHDFGVESAPPAQVSSGMPKNHEPIRTKQLINLQRVAGNAHVSRKLGASSSTSAVAFPTVQRELQVSEEGDALEEEAETVAQTVMRQGSMGAAGDTPNEEDELTIQAKMQVNEPNDQYEQEADAVASQVMRMGEDEEEIQLQPISTSIQRSGASTPEVTPEIEQGVQGLQSGGSPLPDGERQFFENRMGADFSDVRIHNNSQASELSNNLEARAFTTGNSIAFNEGEYRPGSAAGRELLAHELTHVVQQGAAPQVRRKEDDTADDEPETEAPSVEDAVATAGETVTDGEVSKQTAEDVQGEEASIPADDAVLADTGSGEGAGEGAAPEAAAPKPGLEVPTPNLPAAPTPVETPQITTPKPGNQPKPEDLKATPDMPDLKAPKPVKEKVSDAPALETSSTDTPSTESSAPETGEAAEQAAPQTDAPATETVQQPSAEQATPQTEAPSAPAPTTVDEEETAAIQMKRLSNGQLVTLQRKEGGSDATSPRSPEEDPAFQGVVKQTQAVATRQKTHDPATVEAAEAQGAADPQGKDVEMTAQDKQVAEMSNQPPGVFDANTFKTLLMDEIKKVAPSNLKEAEEFKNNNGVGQIKGQVQGQVKDEKQEAEGPIEEKADESPDKSGIQGKPVTPMAPADPGAQPHIDAAGAAPKPKTEGEVEQPIQQGSQELDQQMAEANVTDEQLEKSNEPTFNSALDSKNEAQTNAAESPGQYRTDEDAKLTTAQGDAEMTAEQKAQAMQDERTQLLGEVFGLQGETKSSDEGERKTVAEEITKIYQETRDEVEKKLGKLDETVEKKFDEGADKAQKRLEDDTNSKLLNYKLKRYLLMPGGALLWIKDQLTNLPDEVNKFYEEGRNNYIQDMDGVLSDIANTIATELNAAKEEIAKGKLRIQEYVQGLSPELQQIGQEMAGQIDSKFSELDQTVNDKQSSLVSDLAQKYQQKLQEADAKLQEIKDANKGLVDKAKDAVKGVIETIKQLKEMLEGALARAGSAIQKIIDDPIQFLKNLLQAVKDGFMGFVGNIGTYLQQGLIDWLTGTMGSAGITLPEQFDLKGIFSMVMQILGLTYENIRGQVVTGLGKNGEEIVSALETGWEVFQIIRSEGVAGLWQFIQDQIGDLKQMVIEEVKQMVITQVIQTGIDWVVSLLGGPAGAFVKAVQSIVRVVSWFIDNAQRIWSIVNSIIDSVGAIADGNIGQAAGFIEKTLAQAVPTVIGFLADLLGLGGLAKKVQGIIEKIRAPINKGIQWVVKKAKAMASKVMKMLGFGKDKDNTNNESANTENDPKIKAGLVALETQEQQEGDSGGLSLAEAKKVATNVKQQHPIFKSIKVIDSGNHWAYDYQIQRTQKSSSLPKEEGENKIPPELKGAYGEAQSAIDAVSQMLSKDTIKQRLGEESYSEFQQRYNKLNQEFVESKRDMEDPEFIELFSKELVEKFHLQRDTAKGIKADIRDAMAKPETLPKGAISINGIVFTRTNYTSHGKPIYTDGKRFISADVDSHIGGAWKMASSVEALAKKETRMGTYDESLNRIGD